MFLRIISTFVASFLSLSIHAQTVSFLVTQQKETGLLFQSDSWSAEHLAGLNSPLFKCFPFTLKTGLLSGDIKTQACQFLISNEGFQNVTEPKEEEKIECKSPCQFDGGMSIFSKADYTRFKMRGKPAILLQQVLQGKKELKESASGPKDLEASPHESFQCQWKFQMTGGFKQHRPAYVFTCEFRIDLKGNILSVKDWVVDRPKVQSDQLAVGPETP